MKNGSRGARRIFYAGTISLALAVLALVGSSAALAANDASISGTITAAVGGAAVEGTDACAYIVEPQQYEGCSTSDAAGHYSITGLPAGAYKVGFFSYGLGGGQNFLSQYYDGAEDFATADPINVAGGAHVGGIDAALAVGGQITGTVTDAVSEAPVKEVFVCAYPSNEKAESFCAESGEDGSYEIAGLRDGDWIVSFYAPGDYVGQYFDGKLDYQDADPVTISGASTVPDIDAELSLGAKIGGTVRDAGTNAPLEEIEVCAYRGSSQAGCGTTDSEGKYEIEGLSAGAYKVRFAPSSFYEHSHVAQYWDEKSSFSAADPITLAAAEVRSGIDADLLEAGKIAGTVTKDAGGGPIQGIQVCANPVHYQVGVYACATSDASGNYTISGLSEDEYRVAFSGGSSFVSEYYDNTTYSGAETVSVLNAATTGPIDAALADAGQITGKVIDASSKAALSGFQICVKKVGQSESACTNTAPDGTYAVGGLAVGSYKVRFLPAYVQISPGHYGYANYLTQYYSGHSSEAGADLVSVSAGAATPNIGAEMQPGAQIAGQITAADTDLPIENISACVSVPQGESNCAYSDASGNYSITGLPTGSYKVRFSPDFAHREYLNQYYLDQPSKGLAEAVQATAGSTVSGIDAALHRGGKITGTVTDSADGTPIEGITVCAENQPSGCTYTDSAGHYSLLGLASGSYKLRFTGAYYEPEFETYEFLNYVTQYYDGKSSSASADPVAVTAGSTTAGIDAAMHAGGSIAGTVSAASGGAPLKDVEVCALDASSGSYVRCAYTDAAGQYSIGTLASGSYKVSFSPEYGENFIGQYYSAKPKGSEAASVAVSAPATTTAINAQLSAGGRIAGTVTDAVGDAPLSAIEACALEEGEEEGETNFDIGFDCATSNAAGHYELSGLPSGSYTVSFSPAYYLPGGQQNLLHEDYNGKHPPADSDPVSVSAGSTTSGIDASLDHGAQVMGKVTAAAGGAPIEGVRVCAVSEFGEGINEPISCANTDGEGNYTISALPSGSYKIEFSDKVYEYSEDFEEVLGYEELFASQYYDAKSSLALASPVALTAGAAPVSGIDAALAKPAIAAKPAASTAPALSGPPAPGQVLSCSQGIWTESPSSFAYAWKRDGATIGAESGSTYTVTSADQGHGLSCQVTATNGAGSTTATSNVLSVALAAPHNSAAPTLSGTPALGETLSCSTGSWDNSPTSYAYAWSRGGGAIAGQSNSTYLVVAADQGQNLRCEVSATSAGGTSTAASNSLLVPAAAGAPHNTAAPVLSGDPEVGQTLSCSNGSWDNSPGAFAYAWLRDGVAISGQVSASYKVTAPDQGHSLSCEVKATNGSGSASAASNALPVAAAKPANTTAPKLSGSPALGQQLTCSAGAWDNNPASFAYAWLRDGAPIAGQSATTYVLAAADQGHTIACQVTAENTAGSASSTSNMLSVAAQEVSPPAGGTGNVGGGPSTVVPPPPPPPPPPPTTKALKCKKGFKKKTVHGKSNCVKVKKRHHKKR